jgi:hypothetical protein
MTSLKNSSISEGLKSLSGEVHACTIYPEYMNDPAHNNNPYKIIDEVAEKSPQQQLKVTRQ